MKILTAIILFLIIPDIGNLFADSYTVTSPIMPINVKGPPYFAKGNDIANDTTVLQQALDDGKTQKKPVYIPAGTYKITTALSEYWSGMTIYGDGQQSTIIKQYTANQGGFVSPHNPNDWMCMHDLQFLDASTSNTKQGVYLDGADSVTSGDGLGNDIDDLDFHNITVTGFATALELYGVANSIFKNCTFQNASGTQVYSHGNNNSLTFVACPIVMSATSNYGYHMSSGGGGGVTIQGGDLVGNVSSSGNPMLNDGCVGLNMVGVNVENYGTGNALLMTSGTTKLVSMKFNPAYKIGTTGAYAIQVGPAAVCVIDNISGILARIDWDGTGINVTSTTAGVTADIFSSGTKVDTYPLCPTSQSSTSPSLFLSGENTHNGGAMEWNKGGGSYYYAARANNTVADGTFDRYFATSQDMATSQVVWMHHTAASNNTQFPGSANIATLNIGSSASGVNITKLRHGKVTLAAGAATVTDANVTANTEIHLTAQVLGTVTVPTALAVTARSAGTSFTITSANVVDTSVVAWEEIEP